MTTDKKYSRAVTMCDNYMLMISIQLIVQNSDLSIFTMSTSIQRPDHGRR